MRYIGGIKPSIISYRFLNSVFIDSETNQMYLANIGGNIIDSFSLINSEIEIIKFNEVINVNIGDAYIYSYLTTDNKIIAGTKESIKKELSLFLNSKKLNIHTKLILASFLNLYSKALELIEEVNNVFKEKGIKSAIDVKSMVAKKNKIDLINYSDLLTRVNSKIDYYHELQYEIKNEDIFFFMEDKAYFENMEFPIEEFINYMKTTKFKSCIDDSIIYCSLKDQLDIEKISQINSVFYYFLISDNILNQRNIEKHLTKTVQSKEDKSIVEVSLYFDNEFHNSKQGRRKHSLKKIELLNNCIEAIISSNPLNHKD